MTDGTSREPVLVIERTLDAPVGLVWQMWTDAEHFTQWYGPDGATITVAEFDLRVGGARRVCMEMQTPNGPMQMWFTGEHREIVAPTRLVYTESMADEHGHPLPPPGAANSDVHPHTTEVRIDLQHAAGRTKLALTHRGVAPDSPGAAGWAMALDKLTARIAAHAR